MCRTKAECVRCGREFETSIMVATTSARRGERPRYMCQECASRNESYHTSNNVVTGVAKKNGLKVGVENETSYTDDYARAVFFEYECLPTRDGSLSGDRTCEYVSTTMQGLNRASKLALRCEKLMQDGHLEINESCGTHFHVSINDMKNDLGHEVYMDYIRRFYHTLFIPLCEEMKSDRQTTEKVFGRYFNERINNYGELVGYATTINQNTNVNNRYLFINVRSNSNIEFRINKFTSAKQYQNLMKMEVEMVKTIVENFCKHFMDTDFPREGTSPRTRYRKELAQKTSKKLVRIYKKYSQNI